MSGRAQQQRAFLTRVRPLASVFAVVAFGLTALVTREQRELVVTWLAVGTLGASLVYLLAVRRVEPRVVIRFGLIADTAIVAAMTVVLGHPLGLALGYFWPIGASALVLSGLDAAAFTAFAVAAATITPYAAGDRPDALALIATDVALAAIGAVLAVVARQARRAEAAVAEQAARDATVLALSERIRAPLGFDAVMRHIVEELGQTLDAAVCTVRLAPDERDDSGRLYRWARAGVGEPAEPLPAAVARVFGAREPVAVADVDAPELEPADVAVLREQGLGSGCAYPILWRQRAVALLALGSERPRDWRRQAFPLLERLEPQLAATIVQAQAHERQQQTIEQLRELNALREQLVASVSHELRTPVTATLGFVETLLQRDQTLNQEQRRLYLLEAAHAGRRLARLIDDLLVLTRAERRSLVLQPRTLDPAQLFEHATAGLIIPEERRLGLSAEPDTTVYADPDRLIQVLTNLIANALAHGSGDVRISFEQIPGHTRLSVSDEGAGIDEAQREALFVPFARLGATGEGTGLGLAICKGLVEAHGGSLYYRPRTLDEPHAFVAEFPHGVAERAGAAAVHRATAG